MTWSTEHQLSDGWLDNQKLICLLLMLYGCSSSKTDGHITNLQCFNDYDKKMDCTWEGMNLETTCATQYRMIYEREIVGLNVSCYSENNHIVDEISLTMGNLKSSRDFATKCARNNTCIPENVKIDGFIVPNKCICTILVDQFNAGDVYLIQIQSFGKILVNKSISPFITVKPKTPGKPTIEYSKNGDPILLWDKRYREDEAISIYLKFEIFYYNKWNPRENYTVDYGQVESRFAISRSQLTQGDFYVAKIRAKPEGGYEGIWSDYSSEIEFRNGFHFYTSAQNMKKCLLEAHRVECWDPLWEENLVKDEDRTDNFVYESVPLIAFLACIIIIVVIVTSYFCILIIKQNCDIIPDPSKSSIHLTFVEKPQVSEIPLVYGHSSSGSNRLCHLKVTCWSWLGRFAPSLINQDVVQNPSSTSTRQPYADNPLRKSKTVYMNTLTEPTILLPEKAIVEPCEILSRPNEIDKTPAEEMNQEDEDRKQSDNSNNTFLHPSLNAMFLDMLNIPMCPLEKSVTVVDEYKPCDSLESENALQSKKSSDCTGSFSFFSGTSDEGSCERTSPSTPLTPAFGDSGYHSFESEVGNSDPDPQPHLDHPSCFYGCTETQADVNSELLGECVDTSELRIDPQYRSFTSAILQSEDNLEDNCAYDDSISVNCPLVCSTEQTQGSSTSQQFFSNVVGLDFHCLSHQNDNHHAFPAIKFAEDSFFMGNSDSCITETDIHRAGIDSAALFTISGYQSFDNAVRNKEVLKKRNEDHFSLEYSTNDHATGENKEIIPNEMLFWDTEIHAAEPDAHNLQTKLVHLNTEVGDNAVQWSDSYSHSPRKGVDVEPCDCVFPFVFDKTPISEHCLAGTQEQKRALGPIMCVDQSFSTDTPSNSDRRIMTSNSNMTHDTLTANDIDEHFDCSGIPTKEYLLENSPNGQISLVNHLSKDTEASLLNADFVKILRKESVNGSTTPADTQEISTCPEPAEDNFFHAPASLEGTLLKYQNPTYFIRDKAIQTMLFLKENPIAAAQKKEMQNKIVKLNEAFDADGNSYMTVTELNT